MRVRPMDALVAVLLCWILDNSEFSVTEVTHPNIVEMSPADLTQEYYRDYPDSLPESGVDPRIKALYAWDDEGRGTIYILASRYTEVSLSQETGQDNPWFQEVLLHELVHHVQYVTGAYDEYECANEGELQAYLLGGKFLKQQQVMDPLPNRSVLAHMHSRC